MNIWFQNKNNLGGSSRSFPTSAFIILVMVVAGFSKVDLQAQDDYITLGGHKVHPTQILAKYKDQIIVEATGKRLNQAGSRIQHRFQQNAATVVLEASGPATLQNESAKRNGLIKRINDLKVTGLFEYVEPDYIVEANVLPTDSAFVAGSLWGLRNTGQSGGVPGADISAPIAWDITTGSTNVIVAVIDSGIRYTHRDLSAQMWRNPGESGGGKENNGIDDDANGYIDDVFGINAITGVTNALNGNPMDDNDHGTHCAGTIGAAANDGNSHVGVTWKVRLMACKFLTSGGFGRTSDAIKCIDYAVAKGAKVLNNSWGGGAFSQGLFDSINNARSKGVLFVAAAGNDAEDNDQSPHYPSNYNLNNVLSVAALTRADQLASFSNFGRNTVHLGAPGQTIYSSTATSDTSYANFSGTSMAAPHVAGVAALILSQYPAADLNEVRDRILLGTVGIPALNGISTSGGRLNAYNSLTVAGSGVLQVSVDPPSGSALLTSSSQPVFVTVSDLFGVINATVTATISSGGSLTFANNGVPPDALASNGVYSALFAVTASTNPVSLTISVSAPGKVGWTNVVNYTVLPPPPNDHFTNAVKVASAGGLYLSNNRFGTKETSEPQPAGLASAVNSLWWAWTPVSSTNVFVDTTGSSIDTVLAVYTGNTLASLVPVIATNDVGLRKQAYVIFNAQGGVAYRIQVASAGTNSTGSLQLRVAPGGQYDTTPPQVSVADPFSGITVTTNRITVSGVSSDLAPNLTGVSEVVLSVNGAISYTANGTTNWNAPVLLVPGYNEIIATAIDGAGNASPSTTVQVNYFVYNPINDFMANAIALAGSAGTNSGISTTNATKEVSEQNHAGNAGGKSAWWTFVPSADGVLTLGTTNSSFDTLLGLYTGNSVGGLSLISSNDDAYEGSPGGFSSLVAAVRSNQVYRIVVDGYDGVSGNVVLQHSFVPAKIYRLTININTTTGGTTSPQSMDVKSNDTVSVTAFANAGHTFDIWDGDVVSFANPVSVLVNRDTTITAQFHPVAYTDGFESGNFSRLSWNNGVVPWVVQSTNISSGAFAARSAAAGGNQTSSLTLAGNFRAGTGAFNYRVSSEPGWDILSFHLDGVQQQQWSGEVGWSTFTFPITAGPHTLEWRYSKDANVNVGMDAGFIDNINLPIIVPANGTTPANLKVRKDSAGGLFIDLMGQTNQLYILQASTNLTTWQPISTNLATDGLIRIVDPVGFTNQMRYYRAVVPAQ